MLFLDQPTSRDGDLDLSMAVKASTARIILQARVTNTADIPNQLPARFFLKDPELSATSLVGGSGGWIPLPGFSASAYDIGFVDIVEPAKVPVLEMYQGKYVKSQMTCCLEEGFDAKAHIVPEQTIKVGSHTLKLTPGSEISVATPASENINSFSFADLVNGHLSKNDFKGRVVILGYDSPRAPRIKTDLGPVGVHRWFWHLLIDCYRQLSKS